MYSRQQIFTALIPAAFFCLLFTTMPVYAQKHAPTVDQCRADMRLWLTETDTEVKKQIPASEVNARVEEMVICTQIDTSDNSMYSLTAGLYCFELETRLEDFVQRHGMSRQFKAEDAAGKR